MNPNLKKITEEYKKNVCSAICRNEVPPFISSLFHESLFRYSEFCEELEKDGWEEYVIIYNGTKEFYYSPIDIQDKFKLKVWLASHDQKTNQ